MAYIRSHYPVSLLNEKFHIGHNEIVDIVMEISGKRVLMSPANAKSDDFQIHHLLCDQWAELIQSDAWTLEKMQLVFFYSYDGK